MLRLENELDSYGGYDPRLESNKEVQYYDASSMDSSARMNADEELARRLQTEELSPTSHILSPAEIKNDSYHSDDLKKSAYDVVDFQLRQDAKKADALREQKIRQQEEILNRQKRELENINSYIRPSIVPKPVSIRNYIDPNDGMSLRLYNWGTTLIPEWYSYQERMQAQKILLDFINKEIEHKRSEKELERKIRDMMSNSSKSTTKKAPASRKPVKKVPSKKSKKTSKKTKAKKR